MHKALTVARGTTKFVVGLGTANIVKTIIENNMDEDQKLIDKVSIWAASSVIAGVVVDKTSAYVDAAFEQINDAIIKLQAMANPTSE